MNQKIMDFISKASNARELVFLFDLEEERKKGIWTDAQVERMLEIVVEEQLFSVDKNIENLRERIGK